MSIVDDIEIALLALGLEREDNTPKASGKGTTANWIYTRETDHYKMKIIIAVTPKLSLLEYLPEKKTGGF